MPELEEFSDDKLTPAETRRLRRMLEDDFYARRFKTTIKVWLVTFGTVATVVVAMITFWRDIIVRFLK